MRHILIIGGYGTFGLSLAQRLSDIDGLHITLAGRNADKAHLAAKRLNGQAARHSGLQLDRLGDLAAQIPTPPDLIVDASGPFQSYSGAARYTVINYALAKGCHYLDLSDDAKFVQDTAQFDGAAKAAGLFIRSGVSTYPVVTAAGAQAIVAAIGQGFTPHHITAGIAPSPRAQMGRGVIDAIASYAGKAVTVLRGGVLCQSYGLTQTQRATIAPPGYIPMEPRLFSLVDTPEAFALPQIFPTLQTVECYAGPRPDWLHRFMIILARAVKRGWLPSLSAISGIMHRTQALVKYGPHRGGMFVRVTGTTQNGEARSGSWHMIAEGDDGPKIPTLPACVLIRRWASGEAISAGASTAIRDISLGDLDVEFRTLNIHHGLATRGAEHAADCVYGAVLKDAFDRLPPALADLHTVTRPRQFAGRAKITRGRNPLGQLVAAIFRFPKASTDCPVTVHLTPINKGERWERFFNGKRMVSDQYPARRFGQHQEGLLSERFGPFVVNMAVVISGGRLHLKTRSWRVFGIALPKALMPAGDIYEYETDGRFHFHVDICAPLLGRLVKYEGWLAPTTPAVK